MSTHHQNASANFQFEQSPHRQRVCVGLPCAQGGQFVYAERELTGYRGVGWDPAALPAKFQKLYRKVTVTHIKSAYYPNGSGGWTYWKDYTFTFTREIGPDCNQFTYFKAEGSLNGIVQEDITCPTPSNFTMDWADWQTETDPSGQPGWDDLPPWPGSYPGGTVTNEITAVTEDSVTFLYTASDSGGVFFELETTITVEDPLDTDTIKDVVAAMLASVPLSKTLTPITGVDEDGAAVSGDWGFYSQGADFNHAHVFWDETDCCDAFAVVIPKLAFDSDSGCRCSDDYTGTEYTIRVLHDRKQTYRPAAFTFDIPGGGSGAGSLYSTGDTGGSVIYGYSGRWISEEWETSLQSSVIATADCSAWGKKSLLGRTDPDTWTVLQETDDDGVVEETCLCGETSTPECTTTKCFRAYYPDGADAMVASGNTVVYEIPAGMRANIYREIPALTVEMTDDCPVPPTGEPDCPDNEDNLTTNPCTPPP